MTTTRKRLLILDGHSLAFRAHYALKGRLSDDDGNPTSTTYGFLSMAVRLLAGRTPDGLLICWDTAAPSFRTALFGAYKAHRPPTPGGLAYELPRLQHLLNSAGIASLAVDGFEADDLAATAAATAEAAGWAVDIVTGDRDLFQLVTDNVHLLYVRTGVTNLDEVDPDWVHDKYGVWPSHYPQLAALRGDPSDGIGGVVGVGAKTARRLLETYGDIAGIYANLDTIGGKLAERLADGRETLDRDLRLVKLITNIPNLGDVHDWAWDTKEGLGRLRGAAAAAGLESVAKRIDTLAA